MKDSKTFGGIGALMMVIGALIPYAGPAIALAGFIILLIAYYNISKEVKRKGIWGKMLTWFILNIVSAFLIIASGIVVFFNLIKLPEIQTNAELYPLLMNFALPISIIALVAYIIVLFASWYFYKANVDLGKAYKNNLFSTSGLLFFIGAITTIILVGFLVMWVSMILLVVAFFSKK